MRDLAPKTPSLEALRQARKPAEFVPARALPADGPGHWYVQRRRVYWWKGDWRTADVKDPALAGQELTETEARAKAALLNAKT